MIASWGTVHSYLQLPGPENAAHLACKPGRQFPGRGLVRAPGPVTPTTVGLPVPLQAHAGLSPTLEM